MTIHFVSTLNPPVALFSSSRDSSCSLASSVSTDTINSSQTASLILHRTLQTQFLSSSFNWSLIVRESEIAFDDKDNKLIYHGHTLPCLNDDSFL